MKWIYFLLIVIQLQQSVAQEFSPQLQSMVDAENKFAAYSRDNNMRDAFLANLTDSTVLFAKEGPVQGKQSWLDRQPSTNVLFWRPLFVGISKSNEIGFSTGPWQWSESKETEPVAHGYFATIWQKIDGEWKLAADIGSPMPGAESDAVALHASNPNGNGGKSNDVERSLKNLDIEYNQKIKAESVAFLADYFSKDAMLKHPKSYPAYFPFDTGLLKLDKLSYKTLGGDISGRSDLAYVYGTVSGTFAENGASSPFNSNFLRVWKFEGNEWKIVLEFVSGQQ